MGKANPEVIQLVADFKKKAQKKYKIQKIILFGSQITGYTKGGSDIDLLIVSEKFKRRSEFMAKLLAEWHIVQKKMVPVDFVCFTREEFNRLSNQVTIVKQALDEGVEV